MARQVRALVVLAEDLGSIPNTHEVSQTIHNLLPPSGHSGHCMIIVCINICRQNTHACKIQHIHLKTKPNQKLQKDMKQLYRILWSCIAWVEFNLNYSPQTSWLCMVFNSCSSVRLEGNFALRTNASHEPLFCVAGSVTTVSTLSYVTGLYPMVLYL